MSTQSQRDEGNYFEKYYFTDDFAIFGDYLGGVVGVVIAMLTGAAADESDWNVRFMYKLYEWALDATPESKYGNGSNSMRTNKGNAQPTYIRIGGGGRLSYIGDD